MQGLRRTSDTRQASDSLAQLTLNKRSVQLIGGASHSGTTPGGSASSAAARTSGRAAKATAAVNGTRPASRTAVAATKSAAASARDTAAALAALTSERDLNEQAAERARDVFARAGQRIGEDAARGTAQVVRGGVKATAKAVRGGVVAAQKRVVAAQAAKGAKVAAETTVTASRAAAAVARTGAATAAAVKSIVAVVTAAVSSTPIMAIVSAVLIAVVAILSLISWLPGITSSQRDYGNGGDYPVGVAPGPWGGHENGRIPEELLLPIPWAPDHLLRTDATESLIALNSEYRAEFGHDLVINDAYRDYARQEDARNDWCSRGKCGNAAIPGTSNHGWALAVDLGGGISSFGTAEYSWMKSNGPKYGWQHPSWAEPGGSAPEPWHWDFWGWEGSSGGGAQPEGGAQEYAKQQLPAVFGLMPDIDAQFTCLQTLWMNESGWNHTAENPSSGAYGIPQALPGDKMASHGSDWRTNPNTQINWGLDYIRDRYGTPCQAWQFWQVQNPHWY